MFSSNQIAGRYLQYLLRASNGKGHGTHSPFVYDFIRHVLNVHIDQSECDGIELLRKKLRANTSPVVNVDLGAGSRLDTRELTLQKIARSALKPKKYAQLMYRLAMHFQPASVVELGTSLGITTSYLAKGAKDASIDTVEGNPGIADIARKNFRELGLLNIDVHTGEFGWVLQQLDIKTPGKKYDLVYIDGNHRLAPTLEYFNYFLAHTHENSIVVFDDIHWSEEMETAWRQIRSHPAVRCSIDIFFLGFVFFRPAFKSKQEFEIRF